MKAVRLVEPTRLELVDVDIPTAASGEVLLRVLAAGVCQTDVHLRRTRDAWAPADTTLGHEIAGEVVDVGSGSSGWNIGDTAAVYPVWSCGRCTACCAGRQNACRGTAGRMLPSATPGVSVDGGMAEYVAVPARALVDITGLEPTVAATLTDAALTPYHSIRSTAALLQPGATAAVIGIGGLGRMAVRILRALTSVRVIALDVRLDARRHIQSEVDLVLDASNRRADEQVLAATGGYGAEVVLDLVGNDETLALAARIVAPYGAVRAIGLSEGHFTFETSQGALSLPWGATLSRPYSGTYADLVDVVALARENYLRPEVQMFSLERALEAFDALEAGRLTGRAVLIPGL